MKKFLDGVMEWKTYSCMLFTGIVIIFAITSFVMGQESIPIQWIADLFLISVVGSLIQGLAFSQWVFKKMVYPARMVLFVGIFLPLLSVYAFKRQWFPGTQLTVWLIFLSIFFAIFIGMTVGFEIYFRMTGKKYDGLLGERQKK